MGNTDSIPQRIETAKKTATFTLNEDLKEVPNEVFALFQLKNLDLSNNKLKRLPLEFKNFKKLKLLILDGNKLDELPAHVFSLTLEKISAASNRLLRIDAQIQLVRGLKHLDLSNNQLTEIPELQLKELISLNVSGNQFWVFPAIGALAKLESFDVSANVLQMLPLVTNPKLKALNLANNQLHEFPKDLLLNTSITSVDVTGNPCERLSNLNGYDEYMTRRKDRIDQFLRT